MQTLLKIFRWFLTLVISLLLSLTLLFGIIIVSLSLIITNKENAFELIDDSGLYKNADYLVYEMADMQIDESSEMYDLYLEVKEPDTELNGLFQSIFNEQSMTTKVSTIVDSIYLWLEGQTTKPEFEVQLVDSDEALDTLIRVGIEEKVNAQPACEPDYVAPEELNPFSMSCIPLGYGKEEISEFIDEISKEPQFEEFKDSMTINSDQIEIPIETSLMAQQVFKILKLSPYILFVIVLLLGTLIVLFTPIFPKGLKVAGSDLVFIPAVLLIISIFTRFNLSELLDKVFALIDTSFGQYSMDMLDNLATSLVLKFTSYMILTSLFYIFLAIVLLIIAKYIRYRTERNLKDEITKQPPVLK